MRIVLFGIPEFGTICAQTLIVNGKNIVAIVSPPANHPSYGFMKSAAENMKIPFIHVEKKLKDPRLIDEIRSYNPDIIIIAAYPRLIPAEIYSIPPLGTINCHPSLLPKYRGPNPYFHVIYNGEKETGITFHYTDDSFDTGDIIAQYAVPIGERDTHGTLFNRLSVQSSHLYVELLTKIEKGESMTLYKQPVIDETVPGSPEINMNSPFLKIDWSKSSLQIDRQVRAANPFFGAYTFYRGITTKIWAGNYEENHKVAKAHDPGKIVKVTKDKIFIATGSGTFSPSCLEYGSYYITDVKEFIKFNHPKPGEILN